MLKRCDLGGRGGLVVHISSHDRKFSARDQKCDPPFCCFYASDNNVEP